MNASIALTSRQSEALRFIVGYQVSHGGVSPTTAELCEALGYKSKASITRLLCELQECGCISRLHRRHRAIQVLVPVSIPRAPDGAALFAVPGFSPAAEAPFTNERTNP